ncbi:MAG: SDR family oxidoreductase [Hyphomicrobiales bacterium]
MTEPTRKAALVTGAARRVGRAIAEDLAAAGYAVAIHCNSSTGEAETVADGIRARGGHAAVVCADLSDRAAVAGLVGAATSALGRPPSVLVNNASHFDEDALASLDHALWDKHMALHLEAPVFLTKAFAAALPDEAGEGNVVNIIDQRVWRLTPKFFSYTLSKSALWTATRTMALALAPRIRVNAIGPGPVLASIHQASGIFEAQVEAVPLQRGPAPEEIAAAIRFLISQRSMTGQMLALDGGQHLAWQTPDALLDA